MNSESVELALVALDVYDTELSPHYMGLRAQLAGSLATGQATLEGLRQQEAERRANHDLVRGFTANLPTVKNSSVMVDDPHHARQVQANTLWLLEPYSWNAASGCHAPYYIVGQREATPDNLYLKGSPATDLLLSSAAHGTAHSDLQMVTVRNTELSAALHNVQEASFRDFSEDEIAGMFDRESGMLRVGYRNGMHTKLARPYSLSEASRPKKIAKKVADKGLEVRTVGSYDQRIDDADLASFDVFTSLNRLATAFNKTDELTTLLEAYKQQTSEPVGETGA